MTIVYTCPLIFEHLYRLFVITTPLPFLPIVCRRSLQPLMAWSRYNEDLVPVDDETDSTTDAETDSLFYSSDNETDLTSDANIDDDANDDASLFDDEE